MSSPFPGMDPCLEQSNFWSSFHFRLIGAIAAAITPQLSDEYYIEVELRTYQHECDNEVLIGIPDAAILNRQSADRLPIESQSTTALMTPLITQPETVMLPMIESVKERYLEIRDIQTDAVITPIPLKPNDVDIILDLQSVFDQIYTEARYGMRLDYKEPVPPPTLLVDDRQWLETIH